MPAKRTAKKKGIKVTAGEAIFSLIALAFLLNALYLYFSTNILINIVLSQFLLAIAFFYLALKSVEKWRD
jgi:hypothetical protein